MVLESNMEFSKDFIKVLNGVDNKISEFILSLNGVEVDVNTNFIDVDLKKPDFVTYKPDDKVKTHASVLYKNLANSEYSDILFDKNVRIPVTNQIGQIEDISEDDIQKIINHLSMNDVEASTSFIKIHLIFRWRDKEGEGVQIYRKDSLKYGKELIKNIEFKVGKFASKILNKSGFVFNDQDLEDFVSKYRVSVGRILDNLFDKMELVKGDDIKKWYNGDNYDKYDGTLGSSCMRYSVCQDFFEIYTNNEDIVSLLILKNDGGNKIKARSIIWKLSYFVDRPDVTFMDRVYTNDSSDVQLFIEYANKNGFAYKNNLGGYTFNGENLYGKLSVTLKPISHENYPYMDTLKYYTPDTGELETGDGELTLEDVDGYFIEDCENCGGEGDVECANCEGSGKIDCSECEGDGEYDCSECDGLGLDINGESCNVCNNGRIDCGACDGSGDIECNYCDAYGRYPCDSCNG